jgi:fibronectin-binding autotransporter adhesin
MIERTFLYRVGRSQMFVAAVLAVLPATVAQADKFWRDTVATGNWSTISNWSSVSASGAAASSLPAANEDVNIVNSIGGDHTVNLDISTPALRVVTINQTGGSLNTLSIANNLNLNALVVGGWTGGLGGSLTMGRGAVNQSAGAVTMASTSQLTVAYGAGSMGTYALNGGTLYAPQSEFIGYNGTGTFTQTGGTNTIDVGSAGSFYLGEGTSGTGTYNLSGDPLTSQLIANKSEYIGDGGIGIFNQTGGKNTINGSNNLNLGNLSTATGTYNASGSAALNVGGNLNVGVSGTGTLNVQDNVIVNVTNTLNLGANGHLNFSGGTLHINAYTASTGSVFNYMAGTVRFSGSRVIGSDASIAGIFGTTPAITANQVLTVEQGVGVSANTTVSGGGNLQALSTLRIGSPTGSTTTALIINSGGTVTAGGDTIVGSTSSATSTGGDIDVDGVGSKFTAPNLQLGNISAGFMVISNGGTVTTDSSTIGSNTSAQGSVTVNGTDAKWTVTNNLTVGPASSGQSFLEIDAGGTVQVGGLLNIGTAGFVDVRGGTVAFKTLSDPTHQLNFDTGTIRLIGNSNLNNDPVVSRFFGGDITTISLGRNLTVDGTATVSTGLAIQGGTFTAHSLSVNAAPFQFSGGVLEITGGSLSLPNSLVAVPTGGEFRALGTISQQIAGAAGSTITATGDLTLGINNPAGFYTDGTMNVGTNSVTLVDLNDAVFDSGALVSLNTVGVKHGSLTADNGITLDFGGNFTGYGTITTPNNSAKPLINNGHITGFSSAQPITLAGYVKGVGTFDQVVFTGTYSPGFSPASVTAGSLAFGSASKLVMELGGTTAGSQYDQILATGALAFGGTLEVDLINSFSPTAGNSFNLFDWGSVSGTFALSLPTLGSGLAWNTSQLYTAGVLSVVSAGTPGDYNNNGTVDAGDYVLYRKYAGTTHVLPNDPTGGMIGTAQYNTWRSHFGQPPGSGSGDVLATAVPEPKSGALLAIAILVAFAARRSRKRSFMNAIPDRAYHNLPSHHAVQVG